MAGTTTAAVVRSVGFQTLNGRAYGWTRPVGLITAYSADM